MSNYVNAVIELLGKPYSIRCPETEVASLEEAAKFLNEKMLEVQESGKAINLERIAIITAINITHQFLQQDATKSTFLGKINQRLTALQQKLDGAFNQSLQGELVYSEE